MDINKKNKQNINNIIIDKIVKKGLFLGLKSEIDKKISFEDNYFYSQILPNDTIEYYINENNKVVINKIIKREPFYTIGIVTEHEDKQFFQKFKIYTPLLSSNYKLILKYGYLKYEVGDRIVLYFDENFKIKELHKYKDIKDRTFDKNILLSVYKKIINENNLENDNLIEIENTNIDYYTKKDIIDLSHLNTFNIDPKNSKDFDDAISVDLENNKIYVHIVDINQIHLGSLAEKKAAKLGYTLYLSEGNYNMFSDNLSENKLSLIKNKERDVITIELDIDPNDKSFENAPKVLNYEIYKSKIIIKERFDYESVEKDEVLNNRNDIKFLFDLTSKIYKRPISLPHPNYIINELGKVDKIELEYNNSISHKMIEMFMILTNKLITQHLNTYKKIPERYHAKTQDINLENMENMTLESQLNEIIKLKTAIYDTNQTSHFALNLNNYCHFTSPIRRYFDVIIHRMLAGYEYKNLDYLIDHLNNREELNEKIENLYYTWKLIDFINDHPTKTFEATIIKITKYGIKFYIKELGFNGFVLVRNILENIRWSFDENNNVLKSENIEINKENKINVLAYDTNFYSNDFVFWKILNIY